MNEKQATLSSKLVLLSIVFVASLLTATTLALIVGGGAKPFVLLDPGELVRWGLPMARAIMNVAMATAIGALVVAAFVFAEASKQLRTVMNIAAVASIVWVLAGLLSLNFTYLNITGTVENLARQSGVREGLCLVNAMHITASVFINDDESGLHHDYDVWLEKLVTTSFPLRR